MPVRRAQVGQIVIHPRYDPLSRFLVVKLWGSGRFENVPWVDHPKGAYYLAALNLAKSLGYDDVEEVGCWPAMKNSIIFQPVKNRQVKVAVDS